MLALVMLFMNKVKKKMLMAPHPFMFSPIEKVFIVLLVWMWVKLASNALILWLNSLFIKKLI